VSDETHLCRSCCRGAWWGVPATLLAALLVSSCSRHGAERVGAAAPARPPGATVAIAGTLFNGSDPDQIRAYLQTVKEITPVRFDVQWSPDTVAVSKDEAMRSLLGVSRDGSTFRFARIEPVVARIKPGSILWIYDIAVSHVDRVETVGDIVVVHASPASLTQAFTRADIEFDSTPSLPDLYVGFRPHRNPTGSAAIPHVPRAMPVLWRGAAPELLRVADVPAPPDSPSEDQGDDPDGDYGETRPLGNAVGGELMGFEYSVAYTTSPDDVSLMLEARKKEDDDAGDKSEENIEEAEKEARDAQADLQKQLKELTDLKGKRLTDEASLNDLESQYEQQMTQQKGNAGAQQTLTRQYQQSRGQLQDQIAALDKVRDSVSEIRAKDEERLKALAEAGKKLKSLFEIASDNLDVRFRIRADVDSFSVAGALKVVDGSMESAAAQFKNLKGRIHLDYLARMGKAGNGVVKVPVVGLPYVFNIPFPVAGFPLVIQLGTDFSATVFLAGHHATQQFSGTYEFSGSDGFTATRSGAQDEASISGGEPEVSTAEAQSPGVSGLVLAIQAPRVGVGVGVFGASSVAYVDVVNVVTMTNAASVSTGLMLTPPCRRTTYSAVGSVGIDTHVMPLPIPFVEDAVSKKLTTRKQVFEHQREILNPPVKGCEV
jgi:hypothetical protein